MMVILESIWTAIKGRSFRNSESQQKHLTFNMPEFRAVGFIGLGAMGIPMVRHLADKLPAEVHIHVFDIVESVVDELSTLYQGKIFGASNARDVAAKSVWICPKFSLVLAAGEVHIDQLLSGRHLHHGARRIACSQCLPRRRK